MREHKRQVEQANKANGGARRASRTDATAAIAAVAASGGRGLSRDMVIALQRGVGNAATAGMLQRNSVPSVLRSAGRPLAEPVREEMEGRLGADFSTVRVHDDAAARASAREVGARAYTSGEHVVLGQGGGDRHTLAHELTHVIQQRSGPVDGTSGADGLTISDPSDRFERAAEANAARAMRGPVDLQRAAPERADDHHTAETGALQRVLNPPAAPFTANFDNTFQTVGGRRRVRSAWMLSTGGQPVGTPVSVDPAGHNYIRALGLTLFWIRFHLINQIAGGPGDARNLVPASKRDNSNYERDVENPLKADVRTANATPGDAVFFGVEVSYGAAQQGTSQLEQDNAPFFPTSLVVYHQYYDGVANQWTADPNNNWTFHFQDRQPADPGQSYKITNLSLSRLNSLVSVPGHQWVQDDLAFLQDIGAGNSRHADFARLLNQYADRRADAALMQAFDHFPFTGQRASSSGRPSRSATTGISFGQRISDPVAMTALSQRIAEGTITLT